jgi:hypothetical protein
VGRATTQLPVWTIRREFMHIVKNFSLYPYEWVDAAMDYLKLMPQLVTYLDINLA